MLLQAISCPFWLAAAHVYWFLYYIHTSTVAQAVVQDLGIMHVTVCDASEARSHSWIVVTDACM